MGLKFIFKIYSKIQNECSEYHGGSTVVQVRDFHYRYYRSWSRFGKKIWPFVGFRHKNCNVWWRFQCKERNKSKFYSIFVCKGVEVYICISEPVGNIRAIYYLTAKLPNCLKPTCYLSIWRNMPDRTNKSHQNFTLYRSFAKTCFIFFFDFVIKI